MKGRGQAGWFVLGLVFGVVALAVLALLPKEGPAGGTR